MTATAFDTSAIAPAIKKQKKTVKGDTDSSSKKKKAAPSSQTVKSVKPVDPAIIEQRREAVQARVLKLESRLANDRVLLAKYSVQETVGEGVEKDSGEEEEQGIEPSCPGEA